MTEKQVEAKVEEKVEDSEPTPYRNDYHKDLDKEDPQPDPKAVEAEATQKEEDKSFLSTSIDSNCKVDILLVSLCIRSFNLLFFSIFSSSS